MPRPKTRQAGDNLWKGQVRLDVAVIASKEGEVVGGQMKELIQKLSVV